MSKSPRNKPRGSTTTAPAAASAVRRADKSVTVLWMELFVAVCLTVNFFYLVRPLAAPKYSGNTFPAYTFSYLSTNKGITADDILPSWRTRLLAPQLSSWFLDSQIEEPVDFQSAKYHNFLELARSAKFQNVFGVYHAFWLFLLFLALIAFRPDALLIMAGVFAGLMYNLILPAGMYYYPWDLPTLFFFTLAFLLYDQGRIGLLLAVIWLGSLFKESTLCCSLLVLLGGHWTRPKRIAGFVGVVLATFGANRLLQAHYGVQAPLFPMNNARTLGELVHNTFLFPNLKILFSPDLNHVLFANAGALLLVMLIPWHNRRDVVFKVVILAFAAGQLLFGVINEFRVWYELLPLGWILVSEAVARVWNTSHTSTAPSDETNRLWRASYWLTLCVLTVLTVAMFVVGKIHSPTENIKTKTDEDAFQEMEAAAEQGEVKAQYNLGLAYENKREYAKALPWYERAAEKGWVDAQVNLGMLLCNTKQDYAGAAKWFGLAANQGNSVAQYNLGVLCWSGQAGQTNYPMALQLFFMSARHGDVHAQWILGKIYFEGAGGNPLDFVESYKWSKLATLQGNPAAREELKLCSEKMTADQIKQGEQKAQEFLATGK